MTPRYLVYAAIDSEREYQVRKAEEVSGPGTGEHRHSIEEYALYIDDYVRELKTQLSRTWTADGTVPDALHTVRKIAALAVVCMEQNGAPKR